MYMAYTPYLLLIFAYLLGSINSAIIVCKLSGLPSPRSIGSGNPGATNVLRLGGKKAAAITLIGDVLKGVVPVVIAHLLHLNDALTAWVAFAAILGHIFPLFFKFQGGKGVATAIGALVALNPWLGLITIAIWLIIAALFRYSSLASIICILFSPLFGDMLMTPQTLLPLILLALLIIFRHRANIARLAQGTESKIGKKSK